MEDDFVFPPRPQKATRKTISVRISDVARSQLDALVKHTGWQHGETLEILLDLAHKKTFKGSVQGNGKRGR